MAILIDFSQTVLSSCYAFGSELSVTNPDKDGARAIVRHVILSQIKYWYNKYRYEYGDLIICCDDKKYWRKDLFKNYKSGRKKARAESSLDWKLIFEIMDQTILDLQEFFPYKTLRCELAECDDIIATLTKYFQENEFVEKGLFSVPQKVVIISSDRDFVQLQKFNGVSQVSPRTKEKIVTDNAVAYLKEKVIRGDAGDGIPSILNGDDSYITEGYRCTPMTKKKLSVFMSQEPETCSDPIIKKQWERNRTLIDFDYIPSEIEDSIIEQYKLPVKGNKSKTFDYLMKNQCFQLMEDIDNF